MIEPGVCLSAKRAFLEGTHDAADRYMVALYTSFANLSPDTESYTGDGEVSGDGYTKGGQPVNDWKVSAMGDAARITFSEATWQPASITARGALIYNDSKPGLPAVAVLDFGSDIVSVNGPFTVALPDGEAILTLD